MKKKGARLQKIDNETDQFASDASFKREEINDNLCCGIVLPNSVRSH